MQASHRLQLFALVWLTLCSIYHFQESIACAQGTAFTYQGSLNVNGAPAAGNYDVQFTLYATNVTGSAVAGPVTNNAIAINNGIFTAAVDFGPGAFTGAACWLDVAVRTNASDAFTELTPRQQMTASPYAIYATSAGSLLRPVPAAQLSGTVSMSQLPGGVITNNAPSVNLSGIFSGTVNATAGNIVTTNMAKSPFRVVSPTPPRGCVKTLIRPRWRQGFVSRWLNFHV
jgi:hypothetical protein